MRYREKSVEVNACVWKGDTKELATYPSWFLIALRQQRLLIDYYLEKPKLYLSTANGGYTGINVGDYIVLNSARGLFVYTPIDFESLYEEFV